MKQDACGIESQDKENHCIAVIRDFWELLFLNKLFFDLFFVGCEKIDILVETSNVR